MREFKKGEQVMAGDRLGSLHAGVYIAHDRDSEFPHVVRHDKLATGYRYCQPVKKEGVTEYKKGDQVMLGDTLSYMRPGRFIEMDTGEFPYIGHRVDDPAAQGWKYCQPIRPDFPMDHPVWVWGSGIVEADAFPRHFAGWSANGNIMTWDYGTTSHTYNKDKKHVTSEWAHYSETKPS